MNLSDQIFEHDEEVYNTRAAEIVIPLVLKHVKALSVLDIGCGIGTWLKVFNEQGIDNYYGIEGHYIDKSKMLIPQNNYLLHDLNTPLSLNKQYDLVISLEVAEHLEANAADTFVETLINHGKIILFSAAIPNQGGQNHINEQWPNYWQVKFKKYGYDFYDVIRPHIWSNPEVDVWYRQNIFLVIHDSIKFNCPTFNNANYVHPEMWTTKIESFEKRIDLLEENVYYQEEAINHLQNELDLWKRGHAGVGNYFRLFRKSLIDKLKHSGKKD